MSLADKQCQPCHGGTPKLTPDQIKPMLSELKDWQVLDQARLQKSIKTKDFQQALDLANKIGALAEEAGHHPDLLVRWGELRVDLFTHAVSGLTEADFILAARIDRAVSH
jgi:4a-hydroxytetrahydrobiopterin dehydratase